MRKRQLGSTVALLKVRRARRDVNLVAQSTNSVERGVEAFAPARSRLIWLPVHLVVAVVATMGLAGHQAPWFVVPALPLAIGLAFAGMTFLAHETLHAAVVRNRRLRYMVGSIALLPFVMSPRLWIAWHNRVHHGNANS